MTPPIELSASSSEKLPVNSKSEMQARTSSRPQLTAVETFQRHHHRCSKPIFYQTSTNHLFNKRNHAAYNESLVVPTKKTPHQHERTNSMIFVAIIALYTLVLLDSATNYAVCNNLAGTKSHGGLIREVEKQIVDKILGEGYDKRIRPSGVGNKTSQADEPATIRVNALIRSISKIDDVTMVSTVTFVGTPLNLLSLARCSLLTSLKSGLDPATTGACTTQKEYSVQLTLRQEWTDERLAYNKIPAYSTYNISSITLTEQERVWKPDLFFRNEKEGHFHRIILPNVLLRINGDGTILYSIRISLVLACPMNLKYYPLDKQNCSIEMASYGYTDREMKFFWKGEEPVQIIRPLTLPRFELENVSTAYCESRTATGAYSCIRVDLTFKREFSYYLIQIYIPCCMLVIVSWVSFWLDPNATPARVSLGVTTLLTMATQISGINATLPPVSYIKAIDVWTGVCLTFVFGALLEFALVNYASRSDAHARLHQTRQEEELRARELELYRQQLAAMMTAHQHGHLQNSIKAQYATYGPHYSQKLDSPPQMTNGPLKGTIGGQQQQQYISLMAAAAATATANNHSIGNEQTKQLLTDGTKQSKHQQPDFCLDAGKRQCEIHMRPSRPNESLKAKKKDANFFRAWLNKFPSRSKRIDVISRIFFPKMFALFNLVYWTTYLFRDDPLRL